MTNVRLAQQQPVRFNNTADLLDAIRSTYDSHTYYDTFRAICEVPLLVLEDLGHENRPPGPRRICTSSSATAHCTGWR